MGLFGGLPPTPFRYEDFDLNTQAGQTLGASASQTPATGGPFAGETLLSRDVQMPLPGEVPMPGSEPSSAAKLHSAGVVLGVASAITSAIGSYYQAKSARYQLKSQESSLRFQQNIAGINAIRAENQAQSILANSRLNTQMQAMQYAQQQSAARASMAARGVQAGVGSAGEATASGEYARRVAVHSMNVNAMRQATAARMQRANLETEAGMLGVQAQMASMMRRGISTSAPVAATLLGGAGQQLQNYAYYRRYSGTVSESGY